MGGWGALRVDGLGNAGPGMLGVLPGDKQTFTRSEMYAVLAVLRTPPPPPPPPAAPPPSYSFPPSLIFFSRLGLRPLFCDKNVGQYRGLGRERGEGHELGLF